MSVTVGFLALLEAKPDKADELAAFLEQGRELALAEPLTVDSYAFRIDQLTYGIFDTFALYERGPVVNPRASAGRSVAARGGRPTAWTPAELRPDVGCWRPLWTAGGLVVVWSSAHVSIASSTSRTRCYRGSLRRRMSKKDCQAVRREMALAGAKGLNGWLRVSMYQIASVSLRASSIWATFAPRWRPRRRLVRW